MIDLKKEMTPAALARAAGYTTQTINKWARQFGWKTALLPGVKGGRARVIIIDDNVREFVLNTSRVRNLSAARISEKTADYKLTGDSFESIFINAIRQLTPTEQHQLASLLAREGINGFLQRLGIQT